MIIKTDEKKQFLLDSILLFDFFSLHMLLLTVGRNKEIAIDICIGFYVWRRDF